MITVSNFLLLFTPSQPGWLYQGKPQQIKTPWSYLKKRNTDITFQNICPELKCAKVQHLVFLVSDSGDLHFICRMEYFMYSFFTKYMSLQWSNVFCNEKQTSFQQNYYTKKNLHEYNIKSYFSVCFIGSVTKITVSLHFWEWTKTTCFVLARKGKPQQLSRIPFITLDLVSDISLSEDSAIHIISSHNLQSARQGTSVICQRAMSCCSSAQPLLFPCLFMKDTAQKLTTLPAATASVLCLSTAWYTPCHCNLFFCHCNLFFSSKLGGNESYYVIALRFYFLQKEKLLLLFFGGRYQQLSAGDLPTFWLNMLG